MALPEPNDANRLALLRKSPSVQQLRKEIRKQFQEKLKLERQTQHDRRRKLFVDVVSDVYKHYTDVKQMLREMDEAEFFQFEELLHIVETMEEEVCQDINMIEKEGEQYLLSLEEDTNALVQNLTNVCSICSTTIQNVSNMNMICDDCVTLHFQKEICNENVIAARYV